MGLEPLKYRNSTLFPGIKVQRENLLSGSGGFNMKNNANVRDEKGKRIYHKVVNITAYFNMQDAIQDARMRRS